jgi:hypothetical protein
MKRMSAVSYFPPSFGMVLISPLLLVYMSHTIIPADRLLLAANKGTSHSIRRFCLRWPAACLEFNAISY